MGLHGLLPWIQLYLFTYIQYIHIYTHTLSLFPLYYHGPNTELLNIRNMFRVSAKSGLLRRFASITAAFLDEIRILVLGF
jgi:hypothetical protein